MLIIEETKEGTAGYTIRYLYDDNNLLLGFIYNNTTYYYQRTLTGDIARIVDEVGEIQGEYIYDAYGNILNLDALTEIAEINPFRYKGYYYDQETNLYYCKSRYYSPEIYRWISRDEIEYLDPSSITGCNLYAYCHNNPIMYVDENGNIAGLVTFFIGIFLGKNVKEAYDTAGSLGISGIEQILYAASGIVAGNYYVVKDNWDKVSETIKMDPKNEYNFKFQDNPYYNFKTAHLYAKYLKENFYSEESTRSTLGLYIELQFHYGLFKVGNERGIDGSYMGPAIWQEDSSAFCSEVAATLIRIFYHIQRLRTKTL